MRRRRIYAFVICLALATGACQSDATNDNGGSNNNGNSATAQAGSAPKAESASSSASSPTLMLINGGKETPLEVKSGAFIKSRQTYSDGGKNETATQVMFRIANFDMEASKGAKPLDGQAVAVFILVGASGTDEKAALQTGTYAVRSGDFATAPKFNITSNCGFVMFTNGTPAERKLATSKMQGETKITSVTNDSISGEINVTDGESTIKGTFIATPSAR